jgi:hypothetical protein
MKEEKREQDRENFQLSGNSKDPLNLLVFNIMAQLVLMLFLIRSMDFLHLILLCVSSRATTAVLGYLLQSASGHLEAQSEYPCCSCPGDHQFLRHYMKKLMMKEAYADFPLIWIEAEAFKAFLKHVYLFVAVTDDSCWFECA